jgi:hypothetical protein
MKARCFGLEIFHRQVGSPIPYSSYKSKAVPLYVSLLDAPLVHCGLVSQDTLSSDLLFSCPPQYFRRTFQDDALQLVSKVCGISIVLSAVSLSHGGKLLSCYSPTLGVGFVGNIVIFSVSLLQQLPGLF